MRRHKTTANGHAANRLSTITIVIIIVIIITISINIIIIITIETTALTNIDSIEYSITVAALITAFINLLIATPSLLGRNDAQ